MKNRNIQFKPTLGLLIPFLLGCLALSPTTQALLPPPAPDGGYPGLNTAEGQNALFNLTTGTSNTAVGWHSLSHNLDGGYNTAVGAGTLRNPAHSNRNTAIGAAALFSNIAGDRNTAVGAFALFSNTEATGNTAIGDSALFSNTDTFNNTAIGDHALYSNTEGMNNTAIGAEALKFNDSGNSNTALGFWALVRNTDGTINTAIGEAALYSNTFGGSNTAIGVHALFSNSTGYDNTAVGYQAGNDITGNGNVCIGQGVLGITGENNTTRIRNVYSSVASARAVYVSSGNKIGTLMSSRRFKDEIKLMDKASEAILALKPVTFRYKKEIEPNGAMMFGLIAEEVEKVNPELVTRNDNGEVETVRYEAVNAMLLNEFLKEHRKNEKQEATIAELKAQIATLATTMKEQAAQMQKVSAQLATASPSHDGLEVSKHAPQVALNNQ